MSEIANAKVKEELVPEIISDDSVILNPSENLTKHIIDGMFESEESTHAKIIADENVLRSLRKDFLTSSKTAELIEIEHLELMSMNEEQISGCIIKSGNSLRCVVDIIDSVVISEQQHYDDDVQNSVESISTENYNIRTPPLQNIYDSMREKLGDEVANDYKSVIDGVEQFGSGIGEMDEIAAALLVAAQHGVLLYDVSKWGEDCGLASKATFSRTKTTLEERGYIVTEKVPIEVGRPRLKLQLAPNVFEEEYDGQVISVVQGNLA